MLVDFQAETGWTTSTSGGTVTNDSSTSNFVIGSRSKKLVTNAAGNQISYRNVGLWTSPRLDFTDREFIFWAKVDNNDDLGGASIDLFTGPTGSETSEFFRFNIDSGQIEKIFQNGLWVRCPVKFEDATLSATPPDRTQVVGAQIRVTGAGSNPATVWFNGFGWRPQPDNCAICFVFDDNRDTVYSTAYPYMNRFGIPGTVYTIRDRENTSGSLTFPQMREMVDVHGWAIGAHSDVNWNSIDECAMVSDLLQTQSYLTRNGFRGASHFAYAQGGNDATAHAVARRLLATARTINRTHPVETWPPVDPRRLRAAYVTGTSDGTTLNDAKDWVDRAVNSGGWLILTFHDIVDKALADTTSTEWPKADFESLVDHVVGKINNPVAGQKKVIARTMPDVWERGIETTVATKPAVTGSRGGNAALASLLTTLDNLGIVTDSTTT